MFYLASFMYTSATMNKQENNCAFIDGQNLHLGTTGDGWKIDLLRFRVYLKQKYHVSIAYYFLGCVSDENTELYYLIQEAGFILLFREHNSTMTGSKKGNIDADLVFEMMRHYIDERKMDKVVLVSGDGDYKKVVDYLIKKQRFLKILFPNRKFSSLYKKLTAKYFDLLSSPEIRPKIQK